MANRFKVCLRTPSDDLEIISCNGATSEMPAPHVSHLLDNHGERVMFEVIKKDGEYDL